MIASLKFYIPLSLAQIWKDIRETWFIEKRGNRAAHGMRELPEQYKSPSISSRETQDLRL